MSVLDLTWEFFLCWTPGTWPGGWGVLQEHILMLFGTWGFQHITILSPLSCSCSTLSPWSRDFSCSHFAGENVLDWVNYKIWCVSNKIVIVSSYLIFVASISSGASVKKVTKGNFSQLTRKGLLTVYLCSLCVISPKMCHFTQCIILHSMCNFKHSA